MKLIKRFLYIILCIIFIIQIMTVTVFGEENNTADSIQLGTYVLLGKYNNSPILWKCISYNDVNGKLLLSDKILCLKAYDSGLYSIGEIPKDDEYYKRSSLENDRYVNGEAFWERSNIRAWLNAECNGNEIEWPNDNPPNVEFGIGSFFPYADEEGFLSDNNFTKSEKSLLKTVSQWQILGHRYSNLSTNGIKYCFQTDYDMSTGRISQWHYRDVSLLNHIKGAMYRLNDTILLIDEYQLYDIWNNFGTVNADYADSVEAEYKNNKNYQDCKYWLRDSSGSSNYAYGENGYGNYVSAYALGIRPAFYLNENNLQILSGSGTETDPYIIDGYSQNGISVFSQGEQLQFDQQPIEENGTLLVPVRAIFESLGAEVDYDEGDGVITASNGERRVVMQIDNNQMGNGIEVITLDVAPKLVGDRTVVPLRAVSEAFDCTVDYIDGLKRVVIDKPRKQVFDDYIGSEVWQQPWFIEKYGDWRP